ncbi:hypothetical protein SAMN04487785_10452 [Dyella jiangningensis]|uniref:hypothetical protein n=1 Tax=Dyella sp. AtDHG13 TaxID=1938897 RepID=UPI0008898426|nr:hypothetical protein [Dyella sp. AtDHG13]PXV58767.1 hypothetical protein BDW41_105281 [Dyella sp. AtDHG13]SDJ83388.1 hypothetical protein SAMN04487785_10452 [Dyella jiangningensis]
MNAPDNHLELRARALYREAARQLDPAVAARLRAARREALASASKTSWAHRLLELLLPAGAFAAIAVVALFLSSPVQRPTSVAPNSAQTVDVDGELPPDAAVTDPTLYQNMDFYGWLAKNGDSEASR